MHVCLYSSCKSNSVETSVYRQGFGEPDLICSAMAKSHTSCNCEDTLTRLLREWTQRNYAHAHPVRNMVFPPTRRADSRPDKCFKFLSIHPYSSSAWWRCSLQLPVTDWDLTSFPNSPNTGKLLGNYSQISVHIKPVALPWRRTRGEAICSVGAHRDHAMDVGNYTEAKSCVFYNINMSM